VSSMNRHGAWDVLVVFSLFLVFSIDITKAHHHHNNWNIVETNVDKYWRRLLDWVTRTPSKTGDEHRCSGWVSSSTSTSGTRRVTLVTNPVLSYEWENDRKVFKTSVANPWTLCWLSLFDLRILISPLVSSNSSFMKCMTVLLVLKVILTTNLYHTLLIR
jgi:hypothetical protein